MNVKMTLVFGDKNNKKNVLRMTKFKNGQMSRNDIEERAKIICVNGDNENTCA